MSKQVSKLSKIRRSSWMIPTPKTYVRESTQSSLSISPCRLLNSSNLNRICSFQDWRKWWCCWSTSHLHSLSWTCSCSGKALDVFSTFENQSTLTFSFSCSGLSITSSPTRSGSTTIASYTSTSVAEPFASVREMLERLSKVLRLSLEVSR